MNESGCLIKKAYDEVYPKIFINNEMKKKKVAKKKN
jgi:hypothetical protein